MNANQPHCRTSFPPAATCGSETMASCPLRTCLSFARVSTLPDWASPTSFDGPLTAVEPLPFGAPALCPDMNCALVSTAVITKLPTSNRAINHGFNRGARKRPIDVGCIDLLVLKGPLNRSLRSLFPTPRKAERCSVLETHSTPPQLSRRFRIPRCSCYTIEDFRANPIPRGAASKKTESCRRLAPRQSNNLHHPALI